MLAYSPFLSESQSDVADRDLKYADVMHGSPFTRPVGADQLR